jgi:hypothetical protein
VPKYFLWRFPASPEITCEDLRTPWSDMCHPPRT